MKRNNQILIVFLIVVSLIILFVSIDKVSKADKRTAINETITKVVTAEVANKEITTGKTKAENDAVEEEKINPIGEATAVSEIETTDNRKQKLTQEELNKSIGRYGEVEAIPEDFKFSDAEEKLWRTNHLENIDKLGRLYYEFIKSGSYEEGFTDSVYLDIIRLNEDGTKNALLEFFTGEREQKFSEDNVNSITGNPIVGIYMQGDVLEMNRLTDGHWRHFQKTIKVALRNAVVEPMNFEFNGTEYQGEKISFSPYLNDPHRGDFIKFADKRYEFILSEKIPGMIFQIRTIIPDNSKKSDADVAQPPLIEETLTLIEANFSN